MPLNSYHHVLPSSGQKRDRSHRCRLVLLIRYVLLRTLLTGRSIAGVVGLTTAIKILEEGGHNVTIIADAFPFDPKTIRYTSLWAVRILKRFLNLSSILTVYHREHIMSATLKEMLNSKASSSPLTVNVQLITSLF